MHNQNHMTNITILSYFIGILASIYGLAVAVRPQKARGFIAALKNSDGSFFGVGILGFAVGLMLVMLHNDWGSYAGVVSGIYAWGLALESLLYLFLPHRSLAVVYTEFSNTTTLRVAGIISIGVGLSLLVSILPIF